MFLICNSKSNLKKCRISTGKSELNLKHGTVGVSKPASERRALLLFFASLVFHGFFLLCLFQAVFFATSFPVPVQADHCLVHL